MSHSLSTALELALSARDHPDAPSFSSACALSARRGTPLTPLSRALRAIATGLEADELDRGERDDELGLHSTVWSVIAGVFKRLIRVFFSGHCKRR